MLASKHDRWLVTKSANHTDSTIIFIRVVLIKLKVNMLCVVLLNTILIQAWQTSPFTSKSSTLVTARKHFRTALLHQFDACLLTTYIDESRLIAD